MTNAFAPILVFLISFGSAFIFFPALISRLQMAGIVGVDIHKSGQPKLPEMGGLGIAVGFMVGLIVAISLETFFGDLFPLDSRTLLAVLVTAIVITVIGILDDLFKLGKGAKALLPLLAALPLISVKAGQTIMTIPYLGKVDFGLFYTLVLLPLGVTGATNAANMLAGFNGLEVGMGLVAMGSLTAIAVMLHATTALVLLLAGLGALLATLYYNWYPAKMLIGDVGTLTIGSIIAAAAIVGNFEVAGGIVIAPYFVDFVIKAFNRFPSEGWGGELREGKLHYPNTRPAGLFHYPNPRPAGLCQLIMKITGGISEQALVLSLMAVEAIFGLLAVLIYVRF